MDLFSQFEQRRGSVSPVPPVAPAEEMELDTKHILTLALDGQLRKSYLLPVLPEYQCLFGQAVWICADEDKARRKQSDHILAFAPHELMDIVEVAYDDRKRAMELLAVKRSLRGTIRC